jgi:RNA polymerase sigma-70 factor (ECF subfamily)
MGAGQPSALSSSLLQRLSLHDGDAWRRLVRLYYPLVRVWCERAGLQAEDAADVAQEVFRTLSGNIDRFRREDGRNSFRGWLYGITQKHLLAHWRRRRHEPVGAGGSEAMQRLALLPDLSDDEQSGIIRPADERSQLLRRAVAMLRSEVEERTWQAFWRTVVDGDAPADVAARLGISVNSVYLAKARLLRRLREEFDDLLE